MAIKKLVHHLNLRSTRLLPKLTLTSKIIISFFVITSLSLVVKSISAQTTTITDTIETSERTIDTTNLQGYIDKQTAITKGNNQESWINESLISNTVSLNQALAGTLPNDVSKITSWVPGGVIGFTNNAIASLYQPPASGVQYIANSIDSFLSKPSYAADNGFGFNKLNGILDMWKVTRNAVYTLISLFFIIVGIMIMLRVKINPQTTVTIQSSIPKIISSLILVTFSYAIAGLLIDFSNIFLGIILSLIDQGTTGGLSELMGKSVSDTMSLGFFDFWTLANGYLVSGWTLIATFLGGLAGLGATLLVLGTTSPVSWIVGGLSFAIILLIVYIFAFIQLIKLFIGLAKCYISLIIHIILGPIEIGLGAVPSSKVNFSSWIHQVIAQLATFPSTIIFLVFAIFLTQTVKNTDTFLWSSTILGSGEIISILVGLASLAILSKIPQIVPEFIFKIKPSPIGKAIGDTYSPIGKTFNKSSSAIFKGLVDSADTTFAQGPANKGYQKIIRFTNAILGGKAYRTRRDKDSVTQDDLKR